MTSEQQAHLDRMIERFTSALTTKYAAGQREHGGNVWLKRGMLREAKAEVLDLWVYLDTLEQQIEERSAPLACFLTGYEAVAHEHDERPVGSTI
jgi:hypothetical protein